MAELEDDDEPKQVEAEYLLELPVRCPGCGEDIEAVEVVRLLRSRVNFTSLMPRRGYLVVCPRCSSPLPASLAWSV